MKTLNDTWSAGTVQLHVVQQLHILGSSSPSVPFLKIPNIVWICLLFMEKNDVRIS